MERMLRNKKTILAFLMPALFIYLAIVMVPIASTAYYSVFKWNILDTRKFIGIDNFVQLFTMDDVFRIGMKNTFILMLLSLIVQIPIAIALAIAISGNIKGKRFFKTVFFMPNMLSSVAVGLLWFFIYSPDFGIINRFFDAIGLSHLDQQWLADEKTVLPAIIVVICWQFVGYHMILYLAAIENIPKSLCEAAVIDGASSGQMVRYITLPLIKPIIGIDAVLIATGSLRFFDLIFVMSGGGPNHASEVIASYMYIKSFRDMQYGYGSAISVVLLVLCLVVTQILNKAFKSEPIEF